MFDFTPEIQLNKSYKKAYFASRLIAVFVFFFFLLNTISSILFPIYDFNYTFGLNTAKNTLIDPRDQDGNSLKNGIISQNQELIFNNVLSGNFGKTAITLFPKKNTAVTPATSIDVYYSYKSLFYPIGKPLGFKEGSLLTDKRDFYLISDGKLRKFTSLDLLKSIGLPLEAFTIATPQELSHSDVGDDIFTKESYPNGILFHIADNYYMLTNKKLKPFISESAFLSQYEKRMAIEQDASFFNQYLLEENPIGFADGTIVTLNQSVYILSEGKSYPVDSPETFSALGYNWNNVVTVNSNELSIYAKQKQFTSIFPHPNGTILYDPSKKEYFLVKNFERLPLESPAIAKSYFKQDPVVIDEKSLTAKSSCSLKRNFWPIGSYSCAVDIQELQQFPANTYQFVMHSSDPLSLSSVSTSFSTPLTIDNAKSSLGTIKKSILYNYNQ